MRSRHALPLVLGCVAVALGAWTLLDGGSERRAAAIAPRGPRTEASPHRPEPVLVSPAAVTAPVEVAGARRVMEPAPEELAPLVRAGASALDVLVVDALGAPVAGVPIAWALSPERLAGMNPLGRAETDADGHARLELWQTSADRVLRSYVVRADVPLRSAPQVESYPGPSSMRSVTLRLPPTGGLAVEETDARDEPVPRGALVTLRGYAGNARESVHATCDVVDGRAAFPLLDVGGELTLRVSWNDQGGRPAERVLAGPVAGERLALAVRLPERWPRVALRALAADGTVLARTPLLVRITHAPLSPQVLARATDAHGRLVLEVLGEPHPRIPRRLELLHESARLGARVDLDFALEGTTELGDVRLQPQPEVVLAAGVVRDELGPVQDAEVILVAPRSRRETRTDAAGVFVFVGLRTEDVLALEVRSDSHMPEEPWRVPAGAREVVLALRRAATLVVDLRLDAGLPLDGLHVLARADDGSEHALARAHPSGGWSHSFAQELSDGGELLHGAPVPAGAFTLEVRSREGVLLARVPDVEPAPHGSHAARPHVLDLRGCLAATLFLLHAPDGEPLGRQRVGLTFADGAEGQALIVEPGRLELVLPAGATALELAPPGLARRSVVATGRAQSIVFAPR
jgi:hypothetical protein